MCLISGSLLYVKPSGRVTLATFVTWSVIGRVVSFPGVAVRMRSGPVIHVRVV